MWTSGHFEVEIEFIRHGATEFNEERRYISYTDQPLSSNGKSDIKKRAERGYYIPVDGVFISPLLRARQTAELIFSQMKPVEIQGLEEMNFGIFEGKTYEQLKENSSYKGWLDSGGKCKIEGGESRIEFETRVQKAFNRLLVLAKDASSIAIVAHGGTLMALLDCFTDRSYYDVMLCSGEKAGLTVSFDIKENNDVHISSLCLTYRDNT